MSSEYLQSTLLSLLLVTMLAACGGGGGGGYSSEQDPEARAQAIGSVEQTRGTVVVRSGSEVVLTAKDSEGYDDPLLSFDWRQVDRSGHQVVLVERTAVSRALKVPSVDAPTTLEFELTVTDSDNKTSRDTVRLRVLPVADADLFLRVKVDDLERYQYQLALLTEGDNGNSGEFQLKVETIAQWPDRNGKVRERTLDSEMISGDWPEDFSQAADQALFSPRIVRNLPLLDADDINRFHELAGERDGRLEANRVGDAALFLRFTLEQFDQNVRLAYLDASGGLSELLNTEQGRVDSGLIAVEHLRQAAGAESRLSADKYYALIQAPETMSEWLDITGFPSRLKDSEEVARAIYLNNHDLGFGREMHLRVDERCGNVYSFVNNYPTLENAIQGRGRFATVAMEYAPLDRGCSGEKVIKFLAFVPDESTGENVLMRSMNFDGRGEKFIPGVCVACHRGVVNDLSSVSLADIPDLEREEAHALADLTSTFIPWDLDSLLYAETDPAMTGDYDRIDQQDRDRYSLAAQQGAFRDLNRGALHTYLADPERYAASIKLIHGWYGGYDSDSDCQPDAEKSIANTELMPASITDLPTGEFNGNYTPCGWRGEEQTYHGAVARNCRLCHNQTHVLEKNFDSAEEFFANELLERYVYDEGSMPLARITFDRFWIDFHGGPSGASVLAERLGIGQRKKPGKPVASISTNFFAPVTGEALEEPVSGSRVLLKGGNSRFSDTYKWLLDSNCGDAPILSGESLATASFTLGEAPCRYHVTLEASRNGSRDRVHTEITLPSP